jgi:hypothetical protein
MYTYAPQPQQKWDAETKIEIENLTFIKCKCGEK